ncbi:hypothetical protein [Pyrobaculum ferrireducens]|uniref:Uncharacterized protein n=1 Tax=Pyrobaculum ferrireducens TaxID=1104324 RepID=G7VBW5_9CREN|nr:hypothetical protein [Pyrobaculum ferrireducens]AET32465.1 hypothetical protein P186_1028 [Pyrobaculum ferrireducens]
MVLLVVVRGEDAGRVAERLGCPRGPSRPGELVRCGEYALYLQLVEAVGGVEYYYMDVTLADFWRDGEYLSEEAERAGAYSPERALEVLKRVADLALLAVGSRAPSVTSAGDSVFLHHDFVWVREGFTPVGRSRDILAYVFGSVAALDVEFLIQVNEGRFEKFAGGYLVRLRSFSTSGGFQ